MDMVRYFSKSFTLPAFLLMLAAGLSSCAANMSYDMVQDDSPFANFKVSGSVKDEEGNALKDIQVAVDFREGSYSEKDTLYTDSEGRFEKLIITYPFQTVALTFNDIDGDKNGGTFETSGQEVAPKQLEEGSGRFSGSFKVTADVVLKRVK